MENDVLKQDWDERVSRAFFNLGWLHGIIRRMDKEIERGEISDDLKASIRKLAAAETLTVPIMEIDD